MGDATKVAAGIFFLTTVGLLASTIYLAVNDDETTTTVVSNVPQKSNVPHNTTIDIETNFNKMENKCAGAKIDAPNHDCIHIEGPQAGANVTKGFIGGYDAVHNGTKYDPILTEYFNHKMCPVNVHWHLGTEHYSVGEYDENGDGPHGNIAISAEYGKRRLAEKKIDPGFRCHHYDASKEMFTKPFEWKHCIGMEVGETYEVHWPHSAAGACGTVDQYQTPFYDGVFCNLPKETFVTLTAPQIAGAVGVQAQIYTIVNDESYFYPDMMRGWIVDGDFGKHISYYTGSSTGQTRSNIKCSSYSPITWQVDRKCHMISASSFDKLCYDMKMQRDDMTEDLHAHGSRELVKPAYVANNNQYKGDRRKLRVEMDHDHDHDHDHDSEWF